MTTGYLTKSDGQTVLLQARLKDDGERQPLVSVDGRDYGSMQGLLGALPELAAPQNLSLCCELCAHLQRGPGFMLIDDPQEYRDRYQALLEYGRQYPDRPSTADFGPFDTAEISLPQLTDSLLVFYVEDMLYNLPYRVEVPWPLKADSVSRYLLLPLQE